MRMKVLFWGFEPIFDYFLTGWVNRFANAGDAAIEIVGSTAYRVRFFSFIIRFLASPFLSLVSLQL